ncbi:hypothetical protein EVAR_29543_1 [Eumeta japonica]|uniref:Uncharacterized protein n=1 Tax=Eumeta variegata TaxID=151549 RepID=A0A4C1WGG2_EUMVA|nr:hypothetical protein EVAR_29543_1 [Eumeta japonica]
MRGTNGSGVAGAAGRPLSRVMRGLEVRPYRSVHLRRSVAIPLSIKSRRARGARPALVPRPAAEIAPSVIQHPRFLYRFSTTHICALIAMLALEWRKTVLYIMSMTCAPLTLLNTIKILIIESLPT